MLRMSASVPSGQYVRQVAQKFLALYFRVLNNYPSYLFRFYGSDSTVVVCRAENDGPPMTTKAVDADTIDSLLHTLYNGVSVEVKTCTPQSSTGGCISLLITGIMMTKDGCAHESAFTQALVLTRQTDGYYIRTDTVLIVPLASCPSTSTHILTSNCQPREITNLTDGNGGLNGTENEMPGRGMKNGLLPVNLMRGIELPIETNIFQLTNGTTSDPNEFKCGSTIVTQRKSSPTFNSEQRALLTARGQPSILVPETTLPAIQTCRMLPSRIGAGVRCNDAPVTASTSSDGITIDTSRIHHNQWTPHKSLPIVPRESPELTHNEVSTLFACKLQLGSTTEDVTDVFSQYGSLAQEDGVRVFTGTNNCYARVMYATEQGLQAAMNAEITLNGSPVVTEIWCPRERRHPRRRRPENAAEKHSVATAN